MFRLKCTSVCCNGRINIRYFLFFISTFSSSIFCYISFRLVRRRFMQQHEPVAINCKRSKHFSERCKNSPKQKVNKIKNTIASQPGSTTNYQSHVPASYFHSDWLLHKYKTHGCAATHTHIHIPDERLT